MGKDKTTVLTLVFIEYLQTSIPPPNSVLYAKGYHSYPMKTFCLSAEKFRRGTPLLCSISETNQWRKSLWIRRGGGRDCQAVPSEKVCLTLSKQVVGNPSDVQFCRLSKNVSVKRVGGMYDFPSKLFCRTVSKHSKIVEEPFCAVFPKISNSEKVYG